VPFSGTRQTKANPSWLPEKILEILFIDVRQGSQKPKTRPKSCIDMQQVYDFATTKKDGRLWMPVFG
jgi:ribosomal protein L11